MLFSNGMIYVIISKYTVAGVIFVMANKIFAFVGPFASGKSTVVSQLKSMGIPCLPVYTTKTFKETEKSKTYIYKTMSREEFLNTGDFMVKNSYKGSYYGVKKDDILGALDNNKVSVIVLDANSVKQLSKLVKRSIMSVYLMTDYVALVDRMLRMGLRNDEIKYHLEYAETNKEFDSYKFTNFVVKNTGKLNVTMEQILALMGLMTLPEQKEFNYRIRTRAQEENEQSSPVEAKDEA